jgi:teichuronic acid biosynthesis glycosyltransferase TuaC
MKVLMVCREKAGSSPYIIEQAAAVKSLGADVHFFHIKGKGFRAYIYNYRNLIKKIHKYKPDIIHAHYGLSGLFANLQRHVPVVTTFHGSDINFKINRPLSKIAARLSGYNFYVSAKLAKLAKAKKKYTILPCGVNFGTFYPINKSEARKKMGLCPDANIVLFAGSFSNRIKNAALAKEAIKYCDRKIELLELKGYTRNEVGLLMNACDIALMTSLMEGSPQFIKEAMACNCPVVSTNVGSVEEIISDTDGCFLTNFDPADVAHKIGLALDFGKRINGRDKIAYLDNTIIAQNIISVYKAILKK